MASGPFCAKDELPESSRHATRIRLGRRSVFVTKLHRPFDRTRIGWHAEHLCHLQPCGCCKLVGRNDRDDLSEVERLVLKFTDEVNAGVKASRETLEGLKRHLSPAEIIELLIIIGHWRQTASILETTEVELEDFAGKVDILANMPPRNGPGAAS